jgi:hypothetical protein
VLACYLGLAGWEAARTPLSAAELVLFAALMCCDAICIEATRRLGQPTGVSRDLLSAWWLPVALLLPPVYALVAPAILGLLLYARMRRGPLYRRVFSSAAIGLAGAAASIMFRALSPVPAQGQADGWLTYPGAWASRSRSASPRSASTAGTCSSCWPPTWPCTGPRTPDGTGCACSTRRMRRRTRVINRGPHAFLRAGIVTERVLTCPLLNQEGGVHACARFSWVVPGHVC